MPDKLLFTPGPLTTSATVKEAMLRDLGSRDTDFIATIRRIRNRLLDVAGTSQDDGYEVVLMQGSGTFGLESTVGSVVPTDGALLVIVNGAYGERVVRMAETLGIRTFALRYPEDTIPDFQAVEEMLERTTEITHVSLVHCETTTGILNPVEAIGKIVHRHGRSFMVDAMSSFGALPVDLPGWHIDYLVTSANKCLEGVPGFAIVFARREALEATEGRARSLSLDLLAQWQGLERNGQFRFTPPTHTILAQDRALDELDAEGGVEGRRARYEANHDVIYQGMQKLGFRPYLSPDVQAPIITSFLYPEHPNFDFDRFYQLLSDRDLVIYPGKVSQADCFRIGNIGRLHEDDMRRLVDAVAEVLDAMDVQLPGAAD